MNEQNTVGDYWAAERGSGKPYSWLQSPTLHALLNRRISGDPGVSTAAWFKQKFFPEPAELCLSLGCGFGHFERSCIDNGIAKKFHANDISAGAIEKARQAAANAGMSDKITYEVVNLDGDYNLPPATYDAIFAIASAHHVFQLENLFRQCRAALKPGGKLFLDEYVGPSRFQTPPLATDIINRLLEALPAQYRQSLYSNDGSTIDRYWPLPAGHFEKVDPSEAIRSGELISTLKMYFDVVEYRPYGGGILHMLFSGIMGNFDETHGIDTAFLSAVSIFEETLEQVGALQSDHAAVVAVPRLDILDAAINRPHHNALEIPKVSRTAEVESDLNRVVNDRDRKLALAEQEILRLQSEIENYEIAMRDTQVRLIEADSAKNKIRNEAAEKQRRLVDEIKYRDERLAYGSGNAELDAILNSRAWRLVTALRKLDPRRLTR